MSLPVTISTCDSNFPSPDVSTPPCSASYADIPFAAFPRLLSLALCVFALCTLIVLFVINVPLAGYNLVQFTTRDWDFHQEMWWDPFIPSAVRSKARKCQGTKISSGTRFRLDNDLFDWTVQKLMTREEGQPIQRNNTDFGVVTGWTMRANETLEYQNQPMSSCDLYGVFWKV